MYWKPKAKTGMYKAKCKFRIHQFQHKLRRTNIDALIVANSELLELNDQNQAYQKHKRKERLNWYFLIPFSITTDKRPCLDPTSNPMPGNNGV